MGFRKEESKEIFSYRRELAPPFDTMEFYLSSLDLRQNLVRVLRYSKTRYPVYLFDLEDVSRRLQENIYILFHLGEKRLTPLYWGGEAFLLSWHSLDIMLPKTEPYTLAIEGVLHERKKDGKWYIKQS